MKLSILSGLAPALCFLVASPAASGAAEATFTDATRPVCLQFEPSAHALPAERIREAVSRELGQPLVASSDCGQLTVATDVAGQVVVSYRGRPLVRTVPQPADPEQTATMVALLAGNLVRSEALELIRELAPKPAALPATSLATPATTAPSARRERRIFVFGQGLVFGSGKLQVLDINGELVNPHADVGLGVRVELPVLRNLYLGAELGYSRFNGASVVPDRGAPPPTDKSPAGGFFDVAVVPKLVLPFSGGQGELALVAPLGLSLPHLTEEGAFARSPPPADQGALPRPSWQGEAGLRVGLAVGQTWWLRPRLGLTAELGLEHHYGIFRARPDYARLWLTQASAKVGIVVGW